MSIADALLGMGSGDIAMIDELIEEWDIDVNELADEVWKIQSDNMDMYDDVVGFDANDIITCIYEQIAYDYKLEEGKDCSWYINCLDSHFYYKDEEVYSKEDLKQLIKENKK